MIYRVTGTILVSDGRHCRWLDRYIDTSCPIDLAGTVCAESPRGALRAAATIAGEGYRYLDSYDLTIVDEEGRSERLSNLRSL